MFEDEGDDEDKGSLFGIKPAVNTNTAAPASKVSDCTDLFTLFFKTNRKTVSPPDGFKAVYSLQGV